MQQAGKTEFTSILQVRDAIEAAGYTVEEHFQKYSLTEGTSPNQYFNTQEYLEAKAAQMNADQGVTTWDANAVQLALADAGYTNAYDHFTQYGFEEDVNPSNAFDVSEYLAAKAADAGLTVDEVKAALVDAGLNPVGHFLEYGQDEGLTVTEVPASEQVTPAGDDPDVEGKTFTLTVGADNLSPNAADAENQTTAGDDTIRAVTANSLETVDTIDAGAGTDTMNIADGGIAAGAVPIIKNVDVINVTDATGATLDLADSTGYAQVWVKNTAAVTTTIDNVADLSTIFGVNGSTASGTIDIDNVVGSLTGSSDVLKLAVDDNNGNTATITSTTEAAAIEGIEIDAAGTNTSATSTTGNNANDDVDVTAFTAIESLEISGEGHVTVDASGSAVLETVDASEATGRVNVDASGGTGDQVITTGTGNDTVTAGSGGAEISTGAGSDTITGGAGKDVLDGGTGADTMTGAGAADEFVIETSTIEDLGYDIITDFTGGTDTLKFVGGAAGSSSNYAEVTASGDGFVTARSAANTQLDSNSDLDYVVVEEATAGNSYVFFDGNGDGILDTNGSDFAVQLTGVALAGIAADDIVAA